MKKLIFFVLFLFSFSACQQNSPVVKKSLVEPTATISANVSPSGSAPDDSKIKTYKGRGVVTKINLKLVSVELNHEEIKGLMPKMTMEFYVKEKLELEKLKVGDKVEFVLEDNAGAEQVVSITTIR